MTMQTKSATKRSQNSGEIATMRPQPRRNAGAKSGRAATERAEGRLGSSDLTPAQKIDQHIAGISDWRGAVLAAIRRIMLEADPAVTEDWKWMGSPVWYCDGMIALANAHRAKVKCTFAKGAHIADPDHLFNAGLGGNEWRAIDVLENDRLDEAALRRLVKTAIAYNRSQPKGNAKSKVVGAGRKKA
jgi:hypothetical protein